MLKKLARGVVVVGAGMSKFGTFRDKTVSDLFVENASRALSQWIKTNTELRLIKRITLWH